MNCLNCGEKTKTRHQIKYCSNKCQMELQHRLFIDEWKKGKSVITKNISGYLKRYLISKIGEKCSVCGWNKRHSITGKVPLEIDHVDGNAENNKESNIRLICPNCHALTPHFRNLNRGKGRGWRIKRLQTNKNSIPVK